MLKFEQLSVLVLIAGASEPEPDLTQMLKYAYGEYATQTEEVQVEMQNRFLVMGKPLYETLKELYGDTEEV
jgi:hypothetical protein